MATLGQDLKKERELRGISLKEIADTTKINIRFLQALEEDQIEILPGSFFIKGILRSYSEYLGLDENDILNRYYQEEQLKRQQQDEVEEEEEDRGGVSRAVKNLMTFTAVVIVLVGILVILYFIFHKGEEITPTEQIYATQIPPQKTEVPSAVKEEITKEVTELNFSIKFHDLTWIELYADGNLVLEGNQEPGQEFQTRAERELIINCGNLGGFTYTINGIEGKSLGRSGAVLRDIRINLENLHEFIEDEEDGR